MINDFFNLIFPKLCCACSNTLLRHENFICLVCELTLPKTNYHLDIDNPVSKVFWGRVPIERATSYYSFSKKSKVQNLLHHLKYKGVKELGKAIGELMGHDLKEVEGFKNIDFIIPVPLHKRKLEKRGYNQSEWIALGLSKVLKIPINTHTLYRKEYSQTQTKKTRYKRWENVGSIFGVADEALNNKSVLLVDDVVTTGATLEACALVLIEKGCKISIATIAYA
ncbi:MAG: ComF family protein [Vicingaceae bacterium]